MIIERTKRIDKWERDDLKVVQISHQNLELGQNFNNPNILKKFREFLVTGNYGYYCLLNGECVLGTWIFTQANYSLAGKGFGYDLKENETFAGWALKTEEARGHGVFP